MLQRCLTVLLILVVLTPALSWGKTITVNNVTVPIFLEYPPSSKKNLYDPEYDCQNLLQGMRCTNGVVSEPVSVDGVTVFEKGTRAVITISEEGFLQPFNFPFVEELDLFFFRMNTRKYRLHGTVKDVFGQRHFIDYDLYSNKNQSDYVLPTASIMVLPLVTPVIYKAWHQRQSVRVPYGKIILMKTGGSTREYPDP